MCKLAVALHVDASLPPGRSLRGTVGSSMSASDNCYGLGQAEASSRQPELCFVTLVNDHAQFTQCRDSLQRGGHQVMTWIAVEPNLHGWNAARGLNFGLNQAQTPWVVFSHQDVRFPAGWLPSVIRMLSGLPESVALVGLVGTQADGRYRGHIVDPNGQSYWGPLPADVLVLDEVVLILRRDSGLRFNEDVPGFHCYGTDLCLQAHSLGLRVVAVDAVVRHLSSGRVDESYDKATRWILDRWGSEYGHIIPTPATIIEDLGKAGFLRRMLFRWRRRRDRRLRLRVPPDLRVDGQL